ncbi:M17 family metallopeptidase [Streptomyces sp. NPDC056713]|uniref:M17 family metallopeptidase n=1 Tax=Streptomyces sp. NPDC056713 TaxID=3345921 RepID=UPI0036C0D9F7
MSTTDVTTHDQPVLGDWEARIEAAGAALAGAEGPIRVTALEPGGTADRTIRFVHRETAPHAPPGTWLPFHGELGELRADGSTLWVGLGSTADVSAEQARGAAAVAGKQLVTGTVALRFPDHSPWLVRALTDGLASGCAGAGPIRLLVEQPALADVEEGLLTADVVRLVRLLVSAPANVLTPQRAAAWSASLARRTGLTCTVLGPEQIRADGFGALDAIGAGSVNGPHLVRLDYTASADAPRLGLVGKGITFDSGGLSLKPPAAMQTMRMDMAGAATVLAVLASLRRAGCTVNVSAVLPFAENLPGPGSVRPGDVVTAWNGTHIQILDTDFEGRVVLADALALAASDSPDLLVDLATLTYQAEIALGPDIGAVIGPDDHAAALVTQAAAEAGEPMWRLPWAERYLDQVRTPFGVRNHPLHDTGRALTAALFLGEFVPRTIPWVHCDISGPAWTGTSSEEGATGFGARTLLRLVGLVGNGRCRKRNYT